MIIRPTVILIFICAVLFLVSGCTVIRYTAKAVGTAGRLTVATIKTTGKIVGKTATVTGRGVKTVVNMATGKHIVRLSKKGNSLLADVVLNRRVKTRLVIDTGCTDTQISEKVAMELGIKTSRAKTVLCQLADGRSVRGRQVNIREIRLGGARVYNVKAVVIDSGRMDDDGLLGMSFFNNFIFRPTF